MAEKQKLIIGNWKMNGLRKDLIDFGGIIQRIHQSSVNVVLAPPISLMYEFSIIVRNTSITLSGQNCHQEGMGAYTGEISPEMLKDSGASYVILGHSERRIHHGETSKIVNMKAMAAIKYGLTPIICIGEDLSTYEAKATTNFIQEQLESSLTSKIINGNPIIAYEPIWAIGQKRTPKLSDIKMIHLFIRDYLYNNFGKSALGRCKLIYGGSVNGTNVANILSLDGVDGVLIGGASLKQKDFINLIETAEDI